MLFARINGVLLHYRLSGPAGAPALVVANSLGTDARIWDGVIERLSARYRILSYDKRGHGLSDVVEGEYTLDQHLDDVLGLMDHVGIDRAGFAGVSIGGLIGQGLALRAPERFVGFALCNTAAKVGDAAFWAQRMGAVRADGTAAIADGIMERWFSPGFHRERPDELAGWRNMFLASNRQGYAATCATLRDTDLTADISAISLPTLVVAGSEDRATPVELVRGCADAIPGARFVIIDGVGHIPSIEQPEVLSSMLGDFFTEVGHG
jgi:3-oxoadipate enol-lactonase